MESKVWTNYLKDRRVGTGKKRRRMRALESFRDERERAFRRMVHYQGQYPGCSTTLLTISPNCYTLYLPHSPLSYFPLSPLPLALVPDTLSPPPATITFPPCEFLLAIRNRKLTKKKTSRTAAGDGRRLLRDVPVASSFRLICPLNDRVWIYRVSAA